MGLGFIVFWIGSALLSIVGDFYNGCRMFKDVADQGFLIDIKKYSDYQRQIMPEEANLSILPLLIPCLNLYTVTKNISLYNNARPFIMDQLYMIDCVEEMSDEEKKKYENYPSGVTAFVQSIKKELKPLEYKIDNEKEHGTIYYKLGKKFMNIKVVKLEGDAKKYSKKQATNIVLDGVRENVIKQVQEMWKAEHPGEPVPRVEIDADPPKRVVRKMKQFKEVETEFFDFLEVPAEEKAQEEKK